MSYSSYGATYFSTEWERCVDGYSVVYKGNRLESDYLKNLEPINQMASMILDDILIAPQSQEHETLKDCTREVPPVQWQFAELNLVDKHKGGHAIINYLDWARKFGLPSKLRKPEPISDFYTASKQMKVLLKTIQSGDQEGFMKLFNSGRQAKNSLQLSCQQRGSYSISHRPETFLAGMHIQLAEMVQFGISFERCVYCDEWYLPKRRKQEKRNNFCCTDHEKTYGNAKIKEQRGRSPIEK